MAFLSATSDFVSNSLSRSHTRLPFVAVTGASFTLGLILAGTLSRRETPQILPSLRTLVPLDLSEEEKVAHPFPPDVLPGARDVPTPYGTMRVYEWGPEDGRKVLLVHGISTPCVSLAKVAEGLVQNGCRVMLFDLFGRGYSDFCTDLPQDSRLFTSQIMLALSSSPLAWTGSESGKFALVGYSLGGCIVAAFASYFPHLLSSLIMLAPSGLMRTKQISLKSRILYSASLVPERLLRFLVGRRLRTDRPKSRPGKSTDGKFDASEVLNQELPKSEDAADALVLSEKYPQVSVMSVVNFQLQNHPGFVQAFMSSMRNAPIFAQHELWGRVGKYLAENENSFPARKMLIICGKTDPIIKTEELVEDASAALNGHVEFEYLDAGHEFPITHGQEVVDLIQEYWAS